MPYQWIPNGIFLTYKGITIYYTYANDLYSAGVRQYFYATTPYGSDFSSDNGEFDIRKLPQFEDFERQAPSITHLAAWTIMHAIDNGLFGNVQMPPPATASQQQTSPQVKQFVEAAKVVDQAASQVHDAKVPRHSQAAVNVANSSRQLAQEIVAETQDRVSEILNKEAEYPQEQTTETTTTQSPPQQTPPQQTPPQQTPPSGDHDVNPIQ